MTTKQNLAYVEKVNSFLLSPSYSSRTDRNSARQHRGLVLEQAEPAESFVRRCRRLKVQNSELDFHPEFEFEKSDQGSARAEEDSKASGSGHRLQHSAGDDLRLGRSQPGQKRGRVQPGFGHLDGERDATLEVKQVRYCSLLSLLAIRLDLSK